MGSGDDVGGTDLNSKLGSHCVQGQCHRLLEADAAEILALVIFRFPIANANRLVNGDRVRRHALVESCEIYEGLERGTWLTPRVDGAVELAADVGFATDHGENGASHVKYDCGALADMELGALLGDALAH